jgi:hypothetical protein
MVEGVERVSSVNVELKAVIETIVEHLDGDAEPEKDSPPRLYSKQPAGAARRPSNTRGQLPFGAAARDHRANGVQARPTALLKLRRSSRPDTDVRSYLSELKVEIGAFITIGMRAHEGA